MTVAQIMDRFGIARSTLYSWISERGFPQPVGFNGTTKLWDREAVEAWARANWESVH